MSVSRLIKSILCYLVIIVAILVVGLFWLTASDRAIDYEVDIDGTDIPTFSEQAIDFIPSYDNTKTIPFTASAIIDINGDGVEEIFLGGGINQADAFYQFENGTFRDITAETGWSKQRLIKPLVLLRWILMATAIPTYWLLGNRGSGFIIMITDNFQASV